MTIKRENENDTERKRIRNTRRKRERERAKDKIKRRDVTNSGRTMAGVGDRPWRIDRRVERVILLDRILILPVRLAPGSSINSILVRVEGGGVLIEDKATGGMVADCPRHEHSQPERGGQDHPHPRLHTSEIKRIRPSVILFLPPNGVGTIRSSYPSFPSSHSETFFLCRLILDRLYKDRFQETKQK